MKNLSNLWLALVVAAGLALSPARAAVNDLAEEKTDGGTVLRDGSGSPYRGVLGAPQETESGISGADSSSSESSIDKSGGTSEDGSPKEDAEEKPKKKKKRSSWWPFGRNRDAETKKKKAKKDEESGEITPAVDVPKTDPLTGSTDAGADARPIEPKAESTEPRSIPNEADNQAAASERARLLQESLPAEITERARRGDSRIKDLLEKAQAIKARQAERDRELEAERAREEERQRELERESRRLRELAAKGELPEDPAAAPAAAKLTGSKADKLKELQARREEMIAEGAPQERLDKLDKQIASLKKAAKEPKEPKTAAAKKPAGKSKAARTGKTKPAAAQPVKKKTQSAKAKPVTDDLGAPPLPTEAAPEPAPGEEPAPAPKPKKKKKAAAPVEAPAVPEKAPERAPEKAPEAPALETPAVPGAGEEFKFDNKPSPSPGL